MTDEQKKRATTSTSAEEHRFMAPILQWSILGEGGLVIKSKGKCVGLRLALVDGWWSTGSCDSSRSYETEAREAQKGAGSGQKGVSPGM